MAHKTAKQLMTYEIDDTSWKTLFWSLMEALEDNDDLIDLYEVFEQAGAELDADEGDE
jgi:hypothetical protein